MSSHASPHQGDGNFFRFPNKHKVKTKNTFIHIDTDDESPERPHVDPYAHPKGSLTLSPAMPPSRRRKEAPSGFVLPPRTRPRCSRNLWSVSPAKSDDAMSDVTPEALARSAPEDEPRMGQATPEPESEPGSGTPKRGPARTQAIPETPERWRPHEVMIPETPERAPTELPDYTPERIACLPRWTHDWRSAYTPSASSMASAASLANAALTDAAFLPAWRTPQQSPGPLMQAQAATSLMTSSPTLPQQPLPRRAATLPPQSQQAEWTPLHGITGGGLAGFMFRFTLRRADGTVLGLQVEPGKNDRALLVVGVNKGGAVEAWNKQCEGGAGSWWKAVFPGDMIVQANKALGCAAILEEIKGNHLLQLVIVRAGDPASCSWADAASFFPSGHSSSSDARLGGHNRLSDVWAAPPGWRKPTASASCIW